ncbi:alpha/beta hydrolase [Microbacterium testaceum]|uniref:Alpha/beta hydrolase n=1 Tax=Microbacterium testaceum TaxID=2033 RepID=A0A147EX40_MICTE|nr:alpha/beta hydrolase [Microbacterium testaceum]KTR94480.1 alpha/beta hydrolase [Microbacterium testaceum]
MVRHRLQDHALHWGARALGRVPKGVLRRLNGSPIEVDGHRLHPTVQTSLRVMNASPGAHFERMPLAQARAHIEVEAWTFASSTRLAERVDITIPTRDGRVPARVYRARTDRPARGTVVYFHGGGWVLGSLDSADATCRTLAATTGMTVVSIDYRLAPENPFPAAVHDGVDAFRWTRDNAHRFGGTADAVGVGGESAGGNLAAVISTITRHDPTGTPAFQILFCPVTDLSRRHRSYELFRDGFFLTEAQMTWYAAHYLGSTGRADDPLVSPLLADDLDGLAPAYVAVSGFDVLRDEGIAYAQRLGEAGVDTTLVTHAGQIHGFFNACGALKDARDAVTAAGTWALDRLSTRADGARR